MIFDGNHGGTSVEQSKSLKYPWLFAVRIVLVLLLLIITAFTFAKKRTDTSDFAFVFLFCVIASVFSYSLLSFSSIRRKEFSSFSLFFEFGLDTFIVTLIVFTTGGYYSFLSFLYLVVIMYASMFLYLRAGLIMAGICSFQYTLLLILEHIQILQPFANDFGLLSYQQSAFNIISKIAITSTACFAVAILSGLLTEQNRKTQRELKEMEAHVRRVEKMAYMGEMAAGLAHEIKNPLASLVGSIQMLKDELPYSSDHQYLMEIILRETDRLSTLVTDFLFFARPPVGKPKKLNLREAIDEICALFEKDTSHSGKLFIQNHVEEKMWVLMDPVHFRQVLWNLILNAAEAITTDGIVNLGAKRKKNNDIEISVEDNGCGIPPDKLSSIFDPFYTTKQQGSGLGLSIVHRILESYGSRLNVDTKEHEGTNFSFSLKPVSPP